MANSSKTEPAIRSYFFGKGYRDLRATITESWSRNITTAETFFARAPGSDEPEKLFISGIWYVAGISTVIFGTAFFLIASSLHIVVLGLFFALVYVGFSILWMIERAYLVLRRFFLACPHCHEHTTIPEYYCSGCGKVHSQLLPNSFGIIRHTCTCGQKLPATFWMNRGNLKARCPKCKENIAREHVESKRIFVPIVGGPSAGKSAFLFGAARRMIENDGIGMGYTAKLFDKRSKSAYQSAVRQLERGQPPEKTRDAVPRAFNLSLHKDGKLKYLLYLYDPAGEAYQDTDTIAAHGFQNYLSGMVFLIDPFSIAAVRALYASELKYHSNDLRPSQLPIEDVLDRLLLSLETEFGLKKRDKVQWPIAIVLNKVDAFDLPDLIGKKAIDQAYRRQTIEPRLDYDAFCDDFIRKKLIDWGESVFANRIESRFTNVRYFVCSALGRMPDKSGTDFQAGEVMPPMKWIFQNAEKRNFQERQP